MTKFDPMNWNFKKLENFEFPGGISVYEYKNHPSVDGVPNFMRMNIYLTKSSDFFTIWLGLAEPLFTESRTKSFHLPKNFDFSEFNEQWFRGYIATNEEAGHIFRSLRISTGQGTPLPQILSADTDNKPRWDTVK